MKKDLFGCLGLLPHRTFQEMLDLAVHLKQEHFHGGNPPLFKGKVLAMIFQKPSLRTRMSFDMAMRHMGGDALYISPDEIGLGKRESVADVARVISGYVDIMMARVFVHENVLELAKWASIPVINGLSDYNHPCQAMADALTIYEKFGALKGLNVTFVGDGNNVAVSLIHICAKLGANFTIANPRVMTLSAKPSRMPANLPLFQAVSFIFCATLTKLSNMHRSFTPIHGPAWVKKLKLKNVKRSSRPIRSTLNLSVKRIKTSLSCTACLLTAARN